MDFKSQLNSRYFSVQIELKNIVYDHKNTTNSRADDLKSSEIKTNADKLLIVIIWFYALL